MKTIKELEKFVEENVSTISGNYYVCDYKNIVKADDYEDAVSKVSRNSEDIVRSVEELKGMLISDYPKLVRYEVSARFAEENQKKYFYIICKDEQEVRSLCKWLQKETGAIIGNICEYGQYQMIL